MYCGFKIDVDEGKILKWPEKGIHLKLCIKVCDTGSYSFSDKNDNTIYDTWGYVPNFLEIANGSQGGDYIIFETDINRYIKGWKKKLNKKLLITLNKNVQKINIEKNLIIILSLNIMNLKFFSIFLHL